MMSKTNFIFLGLWIYSFVYISTSSAQDSSISVTKLRLVADAVIKEATFRFVGQESGKIYLSAQEAPLEEKLKPQSPYTDWKYWNGVLNIAMIRLGVFLKDPTYSNFPQRNIAFNFDNYKYFEERYKNEGKWNYPFAQQFIMEELDDCGAMGASVIEVYHFDSQKRYKEYIYKAAEHIHKKQTRLEDGTLVRSFPRKWTLWADDLYMGISFLARMGEYSGENKYFDDAAAQVINFHKYLFDDTIGLMHHCWYSDVNKCGTAYWGRANGWALLAQVDLLDHLPKNHPDRNKLIALLQKHIIGIVWYQSSEGMWHQLLDKPDSYLETSCSAIFTYCIARAVNQKYIEHNYASIAKRGWEGVMSKIQPDGKIEGVCTGTVVSDDLSYYYQRPTPLNDIHGIGFVLLAGSEPLQLPQ
jgi:unsaturated rhamnogalacturonyl hydrolase